MQYERVILASAMMLFGLSIVSVLAEDVENPTYTNWAKHGVGTTVTVRSVVRFKDQKTESTTKTTLKRKDEKSLTLESVTTSDATGQVVKNDPVEQIVKRSFPLFPGVDRTKIGRPQGIMEQGVEKVEILGKVYDAEWYVTKATTEAGPSRTRTWISMEMPGQILKSITEVESAGKKVTDEVIEVELRK